MVSTDFVTVEQQRGDCFKLLAACFYPPDRKVLLEEEVLENLFRLLGAVCPEAAPYAEGMARTLAQATDVELAVAHAKLFVGPFELQAPPYGSLYLESQKRLMGESTMEVLKMYQRAGVNLSKDFQDAPDHIAAELEFMYFLIAKGLRALRKGDETEALASLKWQQEFHDKFLLPWIAPFSERIRTASEHEFYTLLADSLSTFIMKTPVPGTLPGKLDTEV